jgi:hypothetical protein
MSTYPLSIIIIEKNGDLRILKIKDYKEEELYKKCGFKKSEDFIKHHEWAVKIEDIKYYVSMFGKIDGKANMENKYDFPPPIDTKLFFGCCALVAYIKDSNKKVFTNLSLELWTKIYEKLFGGFEDLTTTAKEDEEEDDELESIPKKMKTKKGGYLKDGFVVDDDSDSSSIDYDETIDDENMDDNLDEQEDILILDDDASELSEEQYDYSDSEP